MYFSIDSPAISTAVKSNFLRDEYEKPEREALKQFLDPALPVVEFGGSIGVVSCLTNKQLNDPRQHVVVEASSDVALLLEANRNHNRCRFTVLRGAVAYGSDEVIFYQDANFLGSRAQTAFDKSVELNPVFSTLVTNSIKVPTVNLQDILNRFDFAQCTLICDIEGGEADLVQYEAQVFRDRVATLMVEVHEIFLGTQAIEKMLLQLEEMCFKQVFKLGDTYVFQNFYEKESSQPGV